MKDTGKIIELRVVGNSFTLMERSMKANGIKIRLMVLESKFAWTVQDMKVNGRMISSMDRGRKLWQMIVSMKDATLRERKRTWSLILE
jgi:hypothetical protein